VKYYILYRHYDKYQNLLYKWFKNVTNISKHTFGSKRSALKEEARQISEEVPCFNREHNLLTEAYAEMKNSSRIITRKQVAKKLRMKSSTLNNILNGKRSMGRARAAEMEDQTGIDCRAWLYPADWDLLSKCFYCKDRPEKPV